MLAFALTAGLFSFVAPPSHAAFRDARFDRIHASIERMRHEQPAWRPRDDAQNARVARKLYRETEHAVHEIDRVRARTLRDRLCAMVLRAESLIVLDAQLERAPLPSALADDPASAQVFIDTVRQDNWVDMEAVPLLHDVVDRAATLGVDDACIAHGRALVVDVAGVRATE